MKREELKKLEIADDVIEQIMSMHGKDIESLKTSVEAGQTEITTLSGQLAEAGKTIEGFKSLDVDGIKKAADDYKAQAEQAKKDAQAEISKIKFNYSLESALKEAKVKDIVSVKAHLKTDELKLTDDGKIDGLDKQLEPIKADKGYLFDTDEKSPKIVLGGKPGTGVKTDAAVIAARAAAGLK